MNYLLLFLVIPIWGATSSSHIPVKRTNALEPYHLEIINADIEFLTTHCHSNTDDFGNKTLGIHQNQGWSFRRSFGETTVFSCTFSWKTADDLIYKQTEFEVFNNPIADDDCGNRLAGTNRCFWLVAQNGFYFAKHQPSNWEFKRGW